MANFGTEVGSVSIGVRVDLSGTKAQLAQVRNAVTQTAQQSHSRLVKQIRGINSILRPITMVAKAYASAFTGFIGKALHSLYNMPTKAGKAWKMTFDVFKQRLNIELARIAQIFLKTKIFGKTPLEWMDKLIHMLKKVGPEEIKRFVKGFEMAFATIALSKGFMAVSGAIRGVSMLTRGMPKGTGAAGEMKSLKQWTQAEVGITSVAAGATIWRTFKSDFIKFGNSLQKLGMSIKTLFGGMKVMEYYLRQPKWARPGEKVPLKYMELSDVRAYKPLPKESIEFFKSSLRSVGVSGGELFKPLKQLGPWLKILGKAFIWADIIAGLLKGFGVKVKDGTDLIWNVIKGLWKVIQTIIAGLTLLSKVIIGGAQEVGIILKNEVLAMLDILKTLFTKGILGLIMELPNLWKKHAGNMYNELMDANKGLFGMENSAASEFGKTFADIWKPLTNINKPDREKLQLEPSSFVGQYVGFSEAVQKAQGIQNEQTGYLKRIAELSQRNVDLQTIFANEAKKAGAY